MKWYNVGELSNETILIKKVDAGGKKLCLVFYDGQVFALSAKCPHAGADLSNGWCENGKLVCPFHRYSYNLANGRGSEGQNDYVQTYPVEVRANNIYVGIPSFWERLKGN